MEKKIRELLEDCRDTFDWIVGIEYWDYIEEYSSAEDLMVKIDKLLKEENK